VAVSLLQAVIDLDKNSPTYLIQKSTGVRRPDPPHLPLSSYSYMILPTGTTDRTTGSLAETADARRLPLYAICIRQREMGPIGYSPLPSTWCRPLRPDQKAEDRRQRGGHLPARREHLHNPTFVLGHPEQNLLAQIRAEPLPATAPARARAAGPDRRWRRGAGGPGTNPG